MLLFRRVDHRHVLRGDGAGVPLVPLPFLLLAARHHPKDRDRLPAVVQQAQSMPFSERRRLPVSAVQVRGEVHLGVQHAGRVPLHPVGAIMLPQGVRDPVEIGPLSCLAEGHPADHPFTTPCSQPADVGAVGRDRAGFGVDDETERRFVGDGGAGRQREQVRHQRRHH